MKNTSKSGVNSDRLFKMRSEENCKLFFNLGPNEWHGFFTESVNVSPVGKGKYRIENTPFFARGVSFKDVVSASRQDGRLRFEKVIISSGHSTYRLLLKDRNGNSQPWLEFWKPLEKLGCSYEENKELSLTMLAVDVPSNVCIHDAYELLAEGEEAGVWEFEEGHCGQVGV